VFSALLAAMSAILCAILVLWESRLARKPSTAPHAWRDMAS
jgi:hypothetical protein